MLKNYLKSNMNTNKHKLTNTLYIIYPINNHLIKYSNLFYRKNTHKHKLNIIKTNLYSGTKPIKRLSDRSDSKTNSILKNSNIIHPMAIFQVNNNSTVKKIISNPNLTLPLIINSPKLLPISINTKTIIISSPRLLKISYTKPSNKNNSLKSKLNNQVSSKALTPNLLS